MKTYIGNQDGFICVSVFFMILMVVAILTPPMYMLMNRSMAIRSNRNNYRASYIVESVLELKIAEIIDLCDQAIDDYLKDLETYNAQYIINPDEYITHNPPRLSSYIANISTNIENLSESVNNPFEEYEDQHSYKIKIEHHLNENYIFINSKGEYREARRFIDVKIDLPATIDQGLDEHGLPITTILPAEVIQYYQTFEKINF